MPNVSPYSPLPMIFLKTGVPIGNAVSLLPILNNKIKLNPLQVLSDWHKDLAHAMTPAQAQGQLNTIFKHLNVAICPPISMAQPFFSLPTNNKIFEEREVVDEEMEVSERKRLAFMVANTYKESKTMNQLLGTIDSVHNVREAIEQYGFQVVANF